MSAARYCVVIPNWNGQKLLGSCLDSLHTQTQSAHVIVVDNGSVDGSVDFVKKHYDWVELIELPKNRGFAGGVNVGIKRAMELGAEWVALLNNDAVADKQWLKQLAETADISSKCGIVTSKILRIDGKHLDSTGDFYTTWGLPFPRGRNEFDQGQYDSETDVFSGSGGASLYRVRMLKQIGLFDEAFFAYFEDVDLSFRARLAGWQVAYEPTAIVHHHVNATSSQLGSFSLYHSSKNFTLLYFKDMPASLFFKYYVLFSLQLLRWSITSLLRGHPLAFLKGQLMAALLLPSTLFKRFAIQRKRTISPKALDTLLVHNRPPKLPSLEET